MDSTPPVELFSEEPAWLAGRFEDRTTVQNNDQSLVVQSKTLERQDETLCGKLVKSRYRIEKRIGRGGMSTVYLARDMLEGGLFAIKIMNACVAAKKRSVERFKIELRAVKRVNHPSVIKIFEMGRIGDGRLFMVMEMIHGKTLRGKLAASEGGLSLNHTAKVVCSVATGLQAAHDQGVIHRDLKPGNIIVRSRNPLFRKGNGGEGLAVIVDFGVARLIGTPRITDKSQIVGTPRYISPEQVLGKRVDRRADIYSLGVVIWEMLAGRRIFPRSDLYTMCRNHVENIPPSLSTLTMPAPLPDDIVQLVSSCLEKDRAKRPRNAGEVAAAFEVYGT